MLWGWKWGELRLGGSWQGCWVLFWLWSYLYQQEPDEIPPPRLFGVKATCSSERGLKVASEHLDGATVWSHFLSEISDPLLMRRVFDIFVSSRRMDSAVTEGANEWIYVVTLFCPVPLYLTHVRSVQRPVQYGTLCLQTFSPYHLLLHSLNYWDVWNFSKGASWLSGR